MSTERASDLRRDLAPDLAVVITSVQPPTEAVRAWQQRVRALGASLVVIGDRLGPFEYPLDDVHFLSIDAQQSLPFELARTLPEGHYARKNLGYLTALANGARRLYETDDDNAPLSNWSPRDEHVAARHCTSPGWHNSFAHFTDDWAWPRGFPLEHVVAAPEDDEPARTLAGLREPHDGVAPSAPEPPDSPRPITLPADTRGECLAPIQQGLIDGEPDVDAAWRLLQGERACVNFRVEQSLWFGRGAWTPFNSQSTWWWPRAFPLAYLPATCSFRTTDIWRGLIALRCLWELNAGLAVHAPEVIQERNPHDILRDFDQELPGYLANAAMAELLGNLPLEAGDDAVPANQRACYAALIEAGHMAAEELPLLDAWQRDLARLR
ncbi:MAG: hypothetical protein DHS20C15_17790 [Planctomycetota bacterium]|nr:MAG: hypothetical protein DHS20C15_17790 [Planctomycetota bacterium]